MAIFYIKTLEFFSRMVFTRSKELIYLHKETIMNTVLLNLFAQAYGADTYGGNTYSCASNQTAAECTAQVPGHPDSGVAAQQPVFLFAGAILLAVVLYAITLLAIKKFRTRSSEK